MIVPIVEGHSEVESVPVMMRRFVTERGAYRVDIARPIRVKRNQVVKTGQMERVVDLAKLRYPETQAIMVLLDADDDCPKEVAPQLLERVRQRAGEYIVCSVVLPKRELESWFIASIESLRNQRHIREDALPPANPEDVRDAKGWLTEAMTGHTYIETDDQPAFAQQFDFNKAHERCRSFRKFSKDFLDILGTLTGEG